ncbi:hypothetical protein PRECH8_10850 [Insulibacter thermoxylanivorax]|uniref:DhaL domain-containing protein n=1 Tax=Insulibacter thermoxylanivorax TaxID=2749268 RepID=A0A916VFL5_9BACL|nr:DAK2 domain-containing protein [Insulibacter thermoxylanivorax]GFR37789.1 hypothetical protein PRECH8_10850 [Insulibacter thermoxylanivorax]
MGKRFIDGTDFYNMVIASANRLQANVEFINGLNVFPVPDGDTGTNMNMTLTSGVNEVNKRRSEHLGTVAAAFSKGLLMGARGNSGVILSQLFRGFAKALQELDKANIVQVAQALQQGVDTAYQAVMKPVEGTILTVSREAAKHAMQIARRAQDMTELFTAVVSMAKDALARTPEMLPVLKQVGVVDSGGQGLVVIYEGFLESLTNERPLDDAAAAGTVEAPVPAADLSSMPLGQADAQEIRSEGPAQAQIAAEDILYPYDMEFFIDMSAYPEAAAQFDEDELREQLAKDGDSIIIIADDGMVKVHVHSRQPGDVLNAALAYGELRNLHIVNMRDQHRDIVEGADYGHIAAAEPQPRKENGLLAVAVGDGIAEIFESIGVDLIVSGGQTMNPSTEDLVNAVRQIPAERVFILPNNSNIIMSAQQAQELVEDQEIIVIPTKTIPQGMAAALAFSGHAEPEQNRANMEEAISQVRSGQVTYAVRDSQYEDLTIKEGDYLGLLDNKIVVTHNELLETSKQLLAKMLESGDEIVTVITGADADASMTEQLLAYAEETYPEAEFEVLHGGQPLYYYIFSVE